MRKKILGVILLLGVSNLSFGQNSYWTKTVLKQKNSVKEVAERRDLGNSPTLFSLDVNRINKVFSKIGDVPGKKTRLEFPDANGAILQFDVYETQMMEAGLAAKFPNIKTYKGKSINNSGVDLYISVTPLGVNGLMRDKDGSETFIDTYSVQNNLYAIYRRGEQDVQNNFQCLVQTDADEIKDSQERLDKTILSNDQVYRTFRLAMACTVEYAKFQIDRAGVQGGTIFQKKEAVLSAMVVTMNRVNSIYERDMALHMNLIADNEKLIFIDNDEFDNTNPNKLIDQSRVVINKVIGYTNYDIGHTVSTGGGGLAQLGVPCKAEKAMGITGSSSPIGDPYDIDYVAHEMGHQFGANHTFNNSSNGNRNSRTAYEPGSGSTIMGYAGISRPNVQPNSDSYFHAISILEMQRILQDGRDCAELKRSQNSVPVVEAGDNYTIPVGTPFILKGKATGDNSSSYTYTWEQMDNEITVQPPVSTANKGPNFRSLMPSTSPNRYMPNFEDVLNGNMSSTWEVLPTVARNMQFSLTVRNFANPLGGQVGMDRMNLTIAGTNPFVITVLGTLNEEGNPLWEEGRKEVIEWDVANTTDPIIATEKVNILYSKDNGSTFEMLLANTDNNGKATIVTPKGVTTEARIMIEPVGNIYYALSKKIQVLEGTIVPEIFDNNAFVIYPNPSHGEFRVRFVSTSGENVAITIYDVTGKQVFRQVYEGAENFDETISAAALGRGAYMLKMNDGKIKKDAKIIIK